MSEILMAGCGTKILRRERFINFNRWHASGIRDEKQYITGKAEVKQRTASLTRRDRDKYPEWSGMAGLKAKLVAGCGI